MVNPIKDWLQTHTTHANVPWLSQRYPG